MIQPGSDHHPAANCQGKTVPKPVYGDDDTCVDHASQRETPRPREWGEVKPMEW